ncbi:MAG: hypothetical protein AAGI23_00340 [Bacteroidota bacterium]
MNCLPEDPKSIWMEEMRSIVLVDTFRNELVRNGTEDRGYSNNNYTVISIGNYEDTINIDYCKHNNPSKYRFVSFDLYDLVPFPYRWGDSSDFWLFVDTSQCIGRSKYFYSSPSRLPISDPRYDTNAPHLCRDSLLSYPIFIKNISTDSLLVANALKLPLTLEAKDSFGNWLYIQNPVRYHSGQAVCLIAPNETLLSAFPVLAGDYKADLRLVMGLRGMDPPMTYSNTFQGYIDGDNLRKTSERYRAWQLKQRSSLERE